MAQKFLTNIDLNQNALVNGSFEVLASDPNTGNFEGRLIYNSTEGVIKVRVGSAWKLLINSATAAGANASALTISESNGALTFTPNLATSASAGVMSAADYSKLAAATHEPTVSTLVMRDSAGRFRAEAPSDDKDVANKSYVDAARLGLDVKASVRAATTAPINLATTTAGSVVDTDVTLVAGDRLLVKNQSTGSENGIYVVQASTALVRATDFNTSATVTPGAFTFVEEGTANADSGWVVTTNGTITVGTTAIAFAQFSGAGQITAGDGLSKTGNELDVNVDGTTTYIDGSDNVAVKSSATAGQTLLSQGSGSAAWGALNLASSSAVTGTLPLANGGTNATSAADARTSLAAGTGGTTGSPVLARIVSAGCNASSGSISTTSVTHNFGTKNVIVQIYEVSTGETIIGTVTRGTTNTVSVVLNGANIQANDYTILITG